MEKSAKSPNTAGSISLRQSQHCWLWLEIIAPTNLIRSNLKATAKLYMFCVWCNFLSLCYSWRGNGFRRLKLDNLWPHDRKMIMSRDFDRHIVVLVWRAEWQLPKGDMKLTMEADKRVLNKTSHKEQILV